jgi:hypothetical protein
VWVRYFSIGGVADAVGVAAYLHGHLILDSLQRDIVTHAVNELLSEPAEDPSRPRGFEGATPNRTIDDEFFRLMIGQDAVRQGAASRKPSSLRAPYAHEPAGSQLRSMTKPGRILSRNGLAHPGIAWPALQTRLVSMFNPAEAESRRLESLRSTGLFDSAPEERFDRITRQAQKTFGTSSATISFIGRDRQSVKSATGPLGTNLPRDKSFCSHTIAEDRTLVVPDASIDGRFADNELVSGTAHIRFYAGHPLTGPGGWRIGALCILDTAIRPFTEQDERDLRVLAGLTQLEITSF